ncbi:hypothetical protein ACJJTC_012084 [Scirpophaga incertulas]
MESQVLLSQFYLFVVCHFVRSETFFFEKQYGRGRPVIKNYIAMRNAMEYPNPLPSIKRKVPLVSSPFHSIYQGHRMPNDTRVFRRKFDYGARPSGHRVFCEGQVNCIINYIAIETAVGIPVLLRGGAGYSHFAVVVRARPGDSLNGGVRVYCPRKKKSYYDKIN